MRVVSHRSYVRPLTPSTQGHRSPWQPDRQPSPSTGAIRTTGASPIAHSVQERLQPQTRLRTWQARSSLFVAPDDCRRSLTSRSRRTSIRRHAPRPRRCRDNGGSWTRCWPCHSSSAAQRVLDQHGEVLAEVPDDGSSERPEALRGEIRRILLESPPAGTVR